MTTRLHADRALPVESAAEAVVAWRAWALTGRPDGTELRLRPVAGRSRPWPAGRPAQAVCRFVRLHRAPHPSCTCGLHGTFGLDLLRRTRTPTVLGRVALWGKVIEHEHGYRAEFGYPQRLGLVCPFCFWQWGTGGDRPVAVACFARDELVPLCPDHLSLSQRYGMHPRDLLPAEPIDQSLRDTYAVDPLRV